MHHRQVVRRRKRTHSMRIWRHIRNISAAEHSVMGADMNGHVGTDITGYEGVHGGHGYGMRNEEGERFLEMAQGLDLTIMNTYFKKPEGQKITYRSGTNQAR